MPKPKHMITVSISEQHRDTLLRLAKWLHGGDIAKTIEEALDQYAEKLAGAWDQGESKPWRQAR